MFTLMHKMVINLPVIKFQVKLDILKWCYKNVWLKSMHLSTDYVLNKCISKKGVSYLVIPTLSLIKIWSGGVNLNFFEQKFKWKGMTYRLFEIFKQSVQINPNMDKKYFILNTVSIVLVYS